MAVPATSQSPLRVRTAGSSGRFDLVVEPFDAPDPAADALPADLVRVKRPPRS